METPQRSFFSRFVRSGLVILAVLIVAGAFFVYIATTPMQPGEFYDLPDPLPTGVPGTVVRSEEINNRFVPDTATAWRVMYLTTDMHGEAIAVSGVIVAPDDGAEGELRDVISWATGTTGVNPECGVGHTRNPFAATSGLAELIDLGYVVAITDYPGRGTAGVHPYLIGPAEAYPVLDAVRAAHNLVPDVSDRFAIWGESQGGHSALWSAQLAGDYAPELELIAVATHAGAADLPAVSEANLDKPLGSLILSMSITAWAAYYPEARIEDVIRPESRELFDKLAGICLTKPLGLALVGDLPNARDMMTLNPVTTEPWRSIMLENTPSGPLTVPLLLTHGTDDPLIPIAISQQVFEQRCAAGESATFVSFPGVKHQGSADTIAFTVSWLDDRMTGQPDRGVCEAT